MNSVYSYYQFGLTLCDCYVSDNMSKINLKDIDDELDELSIRILELMNEHIDCKINLERAVRSGCIDLAKTRYIQGQTQVSAMNIPSEDLTATKTVMLSTTKEGKHTFELKHENVDDKQKKSKQDPLKWFGILVPSNLRQGQAWFVKALDLSVQSANISADILVSVDKFEKLLSTKKSFTEDQKT